MVVNIDSSRFKNNRQGGGELSTVQGVVRRPEIAPRALTIGLVNNMAGSAFKATERQFVSLLNAACAGIPIQLSFYTMPGMTRNETGGPHFASHYASIETLWDGHIDGLIVTGREPRMADLRDEPYWEPFTQLLEWARNQTYSAVWSCLAAHAAILHMDGIGRRKSDEKHFGVFDCSKVAEHSLTHGLPQRFRVPHSRWNGVAQRDLVDRGYRILSRIAGDGVDMFVKQEKSLFVFLQGHLEYETDTLMREYRRDVGRYLNAESSSYPLLPFRYFDSQTEKALTILRDKAAAFRTEGLLNDVSSVLEETEVENSWHSSAVCVYRNWLREIRAQKIESERNQRTISAVS